VSYIATRNEEACSYKLQMKTLNGFRYARQRGEKEFEKDHLETKYT